MSPLAVREPPSRQPRCGPTCARLRSDFGLAEPLSPRSRYELARRVPDRGRRTQWEDRVLVVANQTAGSDQLTEVMRARHRERPTAFTLLVPAGTNGRAHRSAAARTLSAAAERMRGAGLELVDARLGAHDPHLAVCEPYDPREYDQIIVSTLETSRSRWLRMDLPRRVHATTGAVVTHVSASGACRTFC